MPHSSASLLSALVFGLLLVSQLSCTWYNSTNLFFCTLQGLKLSSQHHSCFGGLGKSHQATPNHASCALEALVQEPDPVAEFSDREDLPPALPSSLLAATPLSPQSMCASSPAGLGSCELGRASLSLDQLLPRKHPFTC